MAFIRCRVLIDIIGFYLNICYKSFHLGFYFYSRGEMNLNKNPCYFSHIGLVVSASQDLFGDNFKKQVNLILELPRILRDYCNLKIS